MGTLKRKQAVARLSMAGLLVLSMVPVQTAIADGEGDPVDAQLSINRDHCIEAVLAG